jgi:hypothetical protein
MTQIWVVMCVYLSLAYLKFCNKAQASLQHIIRLLALNLFPKRRRMKLSPAKWPYGEAKTVGQQWV